MDNEDHEGRSGTPRRLIAGGLVAILLLVALLAAILVTRKDDGVTASSLSSSSIEPLSTTTTLDTRTEVVERLKEILRIRDRAFHDREAELLKEIYTVDCPCLEGDRNAIQELADNDYHIVGGGTSIRVRQVEQAGDRLWLVIATFRSAPLRVETKDGRLIRKESEGSELFQFALSKPSDSSEWLLGRATTYRDGSG